jgi:NAD(P)-dependent dehydrogenase (short-subunit alcohol dehydrogenase family)
VSDPASVERAFASIRGDMGDVEALIYNAGSGTWGSVETITLEDFEQAFRVNALGAR